MRPIRQLLKLSPAFAFRSLHHSKPFNTFARISKQQRDEASNLLASLRGKPLDEIYQHSEAILASSKDNLKNFLVLNITTRLALEARQVDKAVELCERQLEYLKLEEQSGVQIATVLHDLSILYQQKFNMTFAFKYGMEAEEMANALYENNLNNLLINNPQQSSSDADQEDHFAVELLVLQVNNNLANLYLLSENYDKVIEHANYATKLKVTANSNNLLQQFTAFTLQQRTYLILGQLQEGYFAAEKAAIVAKQPALKQHRAYLSATLGYMFAELSKLDRAKEMLNQAIEIYTKTQGENSRNVQQIKAKLNDIEKKIEFRVKEARQTVEQVGEVEMSIQEYDLGVELFQSGNAKDAIDAFKAALSQIYTLPINQQQSRKGTIMNRIFVCHFSLGNYEEALVTGLECLDIIKFEDNPAKKIKAYTNVAQVYEKLDSLTEAVKYFVKASSIFDFTTSKQDEFLVESSLARIQCLQEHFGEVVNHAKKALEASKNISIPEKDLGFLETGKPEESFKAGQIALKFIETAESGTHSELWCNYLLLKAYEADNYVEKIEKTARKVISLTDKLGKPNNMDVFRFTGLKALANFFLMFGKYQESSEFLEQLLTGLNQLVKDNTDTEWMSVPQLKDEINALMILKVQIAQSQGQFLAALETLNNIISARQQNKNINNAGQIAEFSEESCKMLTLKYQLEYQNNNMQAFEKDITNSVLQMSSWSTDPNLSKGDQDMAAAYLQAARQVIRQFLQGHAKDHPDVCEKIKGL